MRQQRLYNWIVEILITAILLATLFFLGLMYVLYVDSLPSDPVESDKERIEEQIKKDTEYIKSLK